MLGGWRSSDGLPSMEPGQNHHGFLGLSMCLPCGRGASKTSKLCLERCPHGDGGVDG